MLMITSLLMITCMSKNSITSMIAPTTITIPRGVFKNAGNFFIRCSTIPAVQRRGEAHAKTR